MLLSFHPRPNKFTSCCSGFYFIEKTREWYHHQIRRPQATVKKSFELGGGGTVDDTDVQDMDASSWPSSLSGKSICYEVPLKTKTAGINIRKMVRRVTVKLAGKEVTKSISDDDAEQTSIKLLDNVDVHFRRGRMTCLMGTSGAGKVSEGAVPLFPGYSYLITAIQFCADYSS